jgi:peptidyl-prolyl cis-trans isomerase B (cyclophilin B)
MQEVQKARLDCMQRLELRRHEPEGFMKTNDKLQNYQAKQDLIAKRKLRSPRDNRIALIAAASALVLAFAGQLAYFSFGPGYVAEVETVATETPAESAAPNSSDVPDPALAEARTWSGSMALNGAPLGLELYGDLAPQAVANFVSLAKSGYFENLTCHRLTTAGIYVLQCGDPAGDGTGGPGYSWGPVENFPNDDTYGEGSLAMARRGGDGASMGSQFFIVYQESMIPSDAAGGYSVFGKVTSGLDAVKAIAALGTSDGGSDGSPLVPVTISGISVE